VPGTGNALEKFRLLVAARHVGVVVGASWYVGVAYTDSSGAQLQRTELTIKGTEPGTGYEVVGFALYRGADDDLIVASREGWDIGTGECEWQ
jgi:hypothetical protein